jgi:nucleoside-diphosphate-sugar epimerase
MRVLVTGGAGFLGRKLILRLLDRGAVAGRPITRITAFDMVEAAGLPEDTRLEAKAGDIGDLATVATLVGAGGYDAIWHLAAAVSGECERDLDLGYRVNLLGTQNLLAAARRAGNRPLFVFASSVAVFGGPLPNPIPDTQILTPQTSYGAQKAACELLVADFHRKGLIVGTSLRLPTIVVRPGKPNAAASGFASGIVREPLAGVPAICPVPLDAAMYILSPRKVIDALVRAAELPAEALGEVRSLTLPGISYTQGQMLDALRHVAGDAVAARVTVQPDPFIERIVRGWPVYFRTTRAEDLGFTADTSLEEMIRQHIDDELGGSWVR